MYEQISLNIQAKKMIYKFLLRHVLQEKILEKHIYLYVKQIARARHLLRC